MSVWISVFRIIFMLNQVLESDFSCLVRWMILNAIHSVLNAAFQLNSYNPLEKKNYLSQSKVVTKISFDIHKSVVTCEVPNNSHLLLWCRVEFSHSNIFDFDCAGLNNAFCIHYVTHVAVSVVRVLIIRLFTCLYLGKVYFCELYL